MKAMLNISKRMRGFPVIYLEIIKTFKMNDILA